MVDSIALTSLDPGMHLGTTCATTTQAYAVTPSIERSSSPVRLNRITYQRLANMCRLKDRNTPTKSKIAGDRKLLGRSKYAVKVTHT